VKTIHARTQLDGPSLEICIDALRQGLILCYPTETFYALGIDPWNQDAREKLYAIKGRAHEKELPFIVSDTAMIAAFCDVGDPRFHRLSQKFWPGPLTLVLPSRDRKVSYAVRVSSHPIARQISLNFQGPIVSTSANLSGQLPVSEPAELSAGIRSDIAVLIDGGRCAGEKPSTIVSLLQAPAVILREGAVPSQEIYQSL